MILFSFGSVEFYGFRVGNKFDVDYLKIYNI